MTTREIVVMISSGAACGIVGLIVGYVLPLVLFDEATAAPLWGIFVTGPIAFAGGTVVAAVRIHRRYRRIKRGLCPKCAYDLRGSASTSNACPECGALTKTSGPQT